MPTRMSLLIFYCILDKIALTILAIKYIIAKIITINAEHGTSITALSISPETLATRDIPTDANISLLKL